MPSTSDIAGALAAIEARLTAQWAGTTPIVFENKDPADGAVWPPVDNDGEPAPWVYCELVLEKAEIVGFGTPGDQIVIDHGFVKMYVMVAKGRGLVDARSKATALGEIFRQAVFYNSDPTAQVRTMTPSIGQDPMQSDDGMTVCGACCSVPFEFRHRA